MFQLIVRLRHNHRRRLVFKQHYDAAECGNSFDPDGRMLRSEVDSLVRLEGGGIARCASVVAQCEIRKQPLFSYANRKDASQEAAGED